MIGELMWAIVLIFGAAPVLSIVFATSIYIRATFGVSIFVPLIGWALTFFFAYRLYSESSARNNRWKEAQKAEEQRVRIESDQRIAQERAELARQAEQRRLLDAHNEEQTRISSQMSNSRNQAVSFYNGIPGSLLSAEKKLDQAEAEFQAGAFAPYWDAVEGALQKLGSVYTSMQYIATHAVRHGKDAALYAGEINVFPVSSEDIARFNGPANATRARLDQIVRRSQTNYQFASIYEQRKTNAILVDGFQSLSDAVNNMGSRISGQLGYLSQQLATLEDGQRSRHEELIGYQTDLVTLGRLTEAEQIASANRGHEAQLGIAEQAIAQRHRIASEQSAKAERQLAMLDNIQRGREPNIYERGPRRL